MLRAKTRISANRNCSITPQISPLRPLAIRLGGLLAALLKVFGLEGRNGALECSADLADWTVLTNFTFTADPIRIPDPEAGQARFCRLKSW